MGEWGNVNRGWGGRERGRVHGGNRSDKLGMKEPWEL